MENSKFSKKETPRYFLKILQERETSLFISILAWIWTEVWDVVKTTFQNSKNRLKSCYKINTDDRKLNIIDEDGNIISEETRENIHRYGLLHREIYVWFYTLKGEILFQHRAKDKDTHPDLLDATVVYVEIGVDYESTALQELEEEIGIRATKDNLTFIQIVRSENHDKTTDMINNVIRAVYAYRYDGKVENLKIEKAKRLDLKVLLNISAEDKKRFIPSILNNESLDIFRKIKNSNFFLTPPPLLIFLFEFCGQGKADCENAVFGNSFGVFRGQFRPINQLSD